MGAGCPSVMWMPMDGFLVSFWGLRGLEAQKFEEDDQTMEILVCLWRGSFLGSNAPVMALRAFLWPFCDNWAESPQ